MNTEIQAPAGPAEYTACLHRQFDPRNFYSDQGKFHAALDQSVRVKVLKVNGARLYGEFRGLQNCMHGSVKGSKSYEVSYF